MKKGSLWVFIFSVFFISAIAFWYCPKWNFKEAEATIGWDVSGYYLYLPAIFIYHDVKELKFFPEIMKKYRPTPDIQQASKALNGNYVFKYSSGLALQYLPFFLTAHLLAKPLGYEQDGFSAPYQLGVKIGGLLITILGLWFLRKILLLFFSDFATSMVMIIYVFGTNYLNYSAIEGAMTHNWLFTLYAILVYLTHSFYQKPTYVYAAGIGLTIGLLALTRPPEIISILIPLLWNGNLPFLFTFVKKHFQKFILAAILTVCIGSLQLIYWKYASGNWLVYSYGNEGFDWLKPHFVNYLFSYRCGWFMYMPLMILPYAGFYPLFKKYKFFWAVFLFSLLNLYLVCSWQTWWYGHRAMIQSYPILALPLAALIDRFTPDFLRKAGFFILLMPFLYLNLWWTHQLHYGGHYPIFDMTKAYYWKVIGKFNIPEESIKLLDTDEEYIAEKKDIQRIYFQDFENDSTLLGKIQPINGKISGFVSKEYLYSPQFTTVLAQPAQWISTCATFHCEIKEWDMWKMIQLVVTFYDEDKEVKRRQFKLHRLLSDGQTRNLCLDVKVPNQKFTKITAQIWNPDGDKTISFDDLYIESFNEK